MPKYIIVDQSHVYIFPGSDNHAVFVADQKIPRFESAGTFSLVQKEKLFDGGGQAIISNPDISCIHGSDTLGIESDPKKGMRDADTIRNFLKYF